MITEKIAPKDSDKITKILHSFHSLLYVCKGNLNWQPNKVDGVFNVFVLLIVKYILPRCFRAESAHANTCKNPY